MSSCADSSTESESSFFLECFLPSEQSGSLNGKFDTLPVPVALQAGQWNESETEALTGAIGNINAFGNASFGTDLLAFAGEFNAAPLTGGNPPTIVSGSGFLEPLTIHKITSNWLSGTEESGFEDVIAETLMISNPSSGSDLPKKFAVAMRVNYEFFFLGPKKPDLKTIFVHELLHALGLRHSCEGAETEGIPLCGASDLNPIFEEAVMFPFFGFTPIGGGIQIGQVKDQMRENDQTRLNCVYK